MPNLSDDDFMQFVYLSVMLLLLVGSMAAGRGTQPFRHLITWVLLVGGLVALYAYREPAMRLAGPVLQELMPSRAVEVANVDGVRELTIRRGMDGHFQLDADANGTSLRFLVDTGASTTVLSAKDAKRVGIDVDALSFDRPVQTANGMAFYASARLTSLEIGPYRLTDVPVGVMPAQAMDISLLGMSTINRFSGWRVAGDRMVLVP